MLVYFPIQKKIEENKIKKKNLRMSYERGGEEK